MEVSQNIDLKELLAKVNEISLSDIPDLDKMAKIQLIKDEMVKQLPTSTRLLVKEAEKDMLGKTSVEIDKIEGVVVKELGRLQDEEIEKLKHGS